VTDPARLELEERIEHRVAIDDRREHVDAELDGRPFEDFEGDYDWPPTANPYLPWTAGAEPWADFSVRIGRELDRLTRAHAGGTLVVVCHGGVISAALTILAELPLRSPFRLHIDNTSMTEWQLRPDLRGVERWTLVRFNDAAHLADVNTAD
jgi:probable phosphoglycerate mutase